MTRIKIKHHWGFFWHKGDFFKNFIFTSDQLKVKVKVLVVQSCPALCDPWTIKPMRRASAREILQAEILEWFAMTFSRGSSWPSYRTWVSHIAGRFFTIWTTLFIAADIIVLYIYRYVKPIFASSCEKEESDVCRLWTLTCHSENRNHLYVKV